MKKIKLFEEFINEALELATTNADLIKTAKGFKQSYYDREKNNLEPEEIDADFKFITDYLGGDQIVEIVGGWDNDLEDRWSHYPNGEELSARYKKLVKGIKNKQEDELPSDTTIISGKLNGAKAMFVWNVPKDNPVKMILVNIKDIKKFDIGADPFVKR